MRRFVEGADAVSAEARMDLGYMLCRLHWLMRNDAPGSNLHGRIVTPKKDLAAAVKLVLAASPEDLQRQDPDEWWRERRALARKLIDLGDAATAYQVVRQSAPPANPYYRAEFHFMAGWIALRFLADPATALTHLIHIDDGATDPVLLLVPPTGAAAPPRQPASVERCARNMKSLPAYPTAYYGQLARAARHRRDRFAPAAAISERRCKRSAARCGYPLCNRRTRSRPTLRIRPR